MYSICLFCCGVCVCLFCLFLISKSGILYLFHVLGEIGTAHEVLTVLFPQPSLWVVFLFLRINFDSDKKVSLSDGFAQAYLCNL